MTFLRVLLSEERHRQPRAVYKYSAPCRLSCVEIFFTVNNGTSSAIHVAHCSSGSDHYGPAHTGFMGEEFIISFTLSN